MIKKVILVTIIAFSSLMLVGATKAKFNDKSKLSNNSVSTADTFLEESSPSFRTTTTETPDKPKDEKPETPISFTVNE